MESTVNKSTTFRSYLRLTRNLWKGFKMNKCKDVGKFF